MRPIRPVRHVSLIVPALALVFAAACGDDPDDPKDTADTGTADTGDTGEPADTGETGDTGEPAPEGLEGYEGQGVKDGGSYTGTETWYFVAESGEGEDLCLITYDLVSTSVRDDCGDCSWAFDLEVESATVATDADPGCAELLGYDASTVSDLDGSVVSYGYAPEYYGHGDVFMVDTGSGWQAAAFAEFDTVTGAFSYDWEYDERPYSPWPPFMTSAR